MTDRELNIALREMARSAGLCDDWYGKWKDDDSIDDCLQRYIDGHDFAVKSDWPPLEFCREHFNERIETLHKHHIYLDEEVEITDVDNGFYVFVGHCNVELRITGLKAVTVYCRHDSVVNVYAYDGARVFVRYYDQSTGVCKSDDWSKIRKYVYHKSKK